MKRTIVICVIPGLLMAVLFIACSGQEKPFLENAEKIIKLADEKGIQLRLPWGVHITTNRFLENRSSEEIAELINLFKTSKPLGVSKPKTIDVAYFHFTPNGFDFNTYERFSLK